MLRSSFVHALKVFRKFGSSFATLTVKETLVTKPVEQKILVRGWVQQVRRHKDLYFIDLVDGTCLDRLQILINASNHECPKYGSSIKVVGSVMKSEHKGQEIELIADSWNTLGPCAESYPFQYHQKYSAEFIRHFPHLRPRTRRFSSILRIRNQASMAVHKFFQDEGFCFIHTPVITQNDCEGAGEVFSLGVKEKSTQTDKKSEELKTSNDVPKQQITTVLDSKMIPDESAEEFFGAPTYLTVSGQLHLEAMACALTRVYNFGPAFRAEGSQSRLHASEFQMVEAEIAFIENVDELLEIVENCIKKIVTTITTTCVNEINFICQDHKNHDVYINSLLSKPFIKMSYKEAIDILQRHKGSSKAPIKFGDDLGAEHKQFLMKHCKNVPVFVSMFPSSIKPFYMKSNENDMACCFDLFAAFGGEICGGSLREDSEECLKRKYQFDSHENLLWYLDLRKYGTVPHGGFGIGFERLLQSILGIQNIRDVIPFPRRKFDCKC